MVLTEEQLYQITKRVEQTLRDANVYSQVRESLNSLTGDEQLEGKDFERIARAIEDELGFQNDESVDLDPTFLFLQVTLVGGRAFTAQLADNEIKSHRYTFQAHIQFNGQRVWSNQVPAEVEPDFKNQSFTFKLAGVPADAAGWLALLDLDAPLHFCLTRQRVKGAAGVAVGPRELIGSAVVDWRSALLAPAPAPPGGGGGGERAAAAAGEGMAGGAGAGAEVQLVELVAEASTGWEEAAGGRAASGLLEVAVEVAFAPGAPREVADRGLPLDADQVQRLMALAEANKAAAKRAYYLYAKGWWEEYAELAGAFAHRKLKLLAEDERGGQRAVSSYLWPQRCGRLLPTPFHAARTVALLPFHRRYGVGGRRLGGWRSAPALLAARSGDAADHALLLCSLLMGFGLDAYVCMGTAVSASNTSPVETDEEGEEESAHTWVMTFNGAYSEQNVTFWESLTGARFPLPHLDPSNKKSKPHHFRTLTCVFNHEGLWACKQRRCDVAGLRLDLGDPALWRPMAQPTLRATPHELTDVVLHPPTIDADLTADNIESRLKELIEDYRDEKGWATAWDAALAYTLQPALEAYEGDRLHGRPAGNDLFQSALKRMIPDGHCFKGFPLSVSLLDSNKIFQKLTETRLSKDVLDSHGDYIRFAIRVRVFPYPEDLVSTWVMIAVRYQPVSTL